MPERAKVIAKSSNDAFPESNAMREARCQVNMTPEKNHMCAVYFAWNSPEVPVVVRFLFSRHTRKSKETAKSSDDVFREFNVVREAQKRRRPDP